MKKILINIICVTLFLFFLTGCSITDKKNEEELMKEKTYTEMQFIEDAVFNITNKYAKGEYIKDDDIEWDSILDDEKKINEVLETIILDLSEMNISKENLVLLSNELNNLLAITINEDEEQLIISLQKLYGLVPKFLNEFSDDKNSIKDKELKEIVLLSFGFANIENWEESKININNAINKYNEMMNDVDYMKERSYSLNKVYVLLGEIKNAIESENLELVKLKFVNFIEKT